MPGHLLHIGTVSKAHGIKGEVCVEYYADSSDLLYGPLFFQAPDGKSRPCKVATVRKDHSRLLVRFEEYPDRTAAEKLRGLKLVAPVDALPEPNDDEVYLHDLMDMLVILVHDDESEEELGRISDIAAPAGQELWTITTANGEEILLPAVPEFIAGVDTQAREVFITPPPGLIELYLNPASETAS